MENTNQNEIIKSEKKYEYSEKADKFERVIRNKVFDNINFRDFSGIKFINCIFNSCDFTSSIISDCLFDENTKFYECNFYHTFFDSVEFNSYCDDCSFVGSTLRCSFLNLKNFEECIVCDSLSFGSQINFSDNAILKNELSIRKHNIRDDYYDFSKK